MEAPIFAYALLKLAARCNLDCSYCYWFRDESVYLKPKVLTEESEFAFVERLESHLVEFQIRDFTLLLHGGEPLLFGKRRFRSFLERLGGVEARTGCEITYLITTNGVLIDSEWAELFRQFGVYVSVSVDGPADVHDQCRVDAAGRGSHSMAVRAISILRAAGLKPGVISVCNLDHDPRRLLEHIVDDLGVQNFDVLPPDFTHEDVVRPIGAYYIRLFDQWFDFYADQGVRISLLDGIIGGLLGQEPVTDSIGAGPVHTVTVLTDGSLEPLDVLRIGGNERTKTSLNIANNSIQDVVENPVWARAYEASLNLSEPCQKCVYREACGGGHLAHRWSRERGYDNPSVYCADWIEIFQHVWKRIAPQVDLDLNGERIPLAEALKNVGLAC